MMYLMISVVDIVNAVGVTIQTIAVVLFSEGSLGFGGLRSFYLVSYAISAISYRTSVFYNVVLGVSRTINILNPFYRIKKNVVFVICLLYPISWILIVAQDVYYNTTLGTDWIFTILIIPIPGSHLWTNSSDFFLEMCLVIPFIIPAVIVIVTCIIQIVSLYSTSLQGKDNQRHITITILMLSVLFVVFNSAYSVYICFLIVTQDGSEFENYFLYTQIFGTMMPITNAAFNPVIIIFRSKAIREDFVAVLGGMRSEARNIMKWTISTTTEHGLSKKDCGDEINGCSSKDAVHGNEETVCDHAKDKVNEEKKIVGEEKVLIEEEKVLVDKEKGLASEVHGSDHVYDVHERADGVSAGGDGLEDEDPRSEEHD